MYGCPFGYAGYENGVKILENVDISTPPPY